MIGSRICGCLPLLLCSHSRRSPAAALLLVHPRPPSALNQQFSRGLLAARSW